MGNEATKGCISRAEVHFLQARSAWQGKVSGEKTGGAAVVERTERDLHGGQVLLHDYG